MIFALFGCSGDDNGDLDCSNVLCALPSFVFEIRSQVDDEDLFVNGTFNPEDLQIMDVQEGGTASFSFGNVGDGVLFFINEPSIVSENKIYEVSVPMEFAFTINYTKVAVNLDECCPGINFENINIPNTEFELNETNNSYIVRI